MAFDKFRRLHKHSAAPAAGVIHPPVIGLQDFHQCAHHAGRRVEFARQLALLLGKFGKAVFVGSAENVLFVSVLDHADVGEKIDHLTQPSLVQLRTGKVFRQNVLQALVVLLNRAHGFVNRRADFRCVCLGGNVTPPRALRHKENPLGGVLVDILLEAVAFRDKLAVLFLEAVGDVFEENQPQHHIFVFRGVHIPAQYARGVPYLFFKADVGGCFFSHCFSPIRFDTSGQYSKLYQYNYIGCRIKCQGYLRYLLRDFTSSKK